MDGAAGLSTNPFLPFFHFLSFLPFFHFLAFLSFLHFLNPCP
jgi:hypothetical protein